MKSAISLLIIIILFGYNGFAQVYGWLQTISPGGNEYCWDVAADDFGNYFGTGRVKANSTFGTSPYTSSPPMIGAETDVFLAKYKKNGQLVWAARHGGVQPDWGRCVVADKDGNAIIAGDYCDTANFGTFHLPKIGVTLNRNIFIAKYDSTGNCLWAKYAGNAANYSRAYAVSVDDKGNIYVGGHISGPSNFDGVTFGFTGKNLPFIAKFSSNGVCQWAKHIYCGFNGEVYDLIYNNATDKIYVTGGYRGSIIVNAVTYPGNSPSWSDVFTVEMDTLGNFGWISTAIGGFQDQPYAIDFDSLNNIYIGGTFANDLTFGTTTINSQVSGSTATVANSHVNGFITKYSPTGIFQWVETVKCDSALTLDDICVTSSGKILVINSIREQAYLQDDTIPHPYTQEKSILSCYDLNGNQLWYKVTGTGQLSFSYCVMRGVSRNKFDDIIIGGEYAGSACYFDSFVDPSAAGWDAFLTKFYMPLDPRIQISDTSLCIGDTIKITILQEGSEIEIAWLGVPPGLNFITTTNPYFAVVTDSFSYSPSVQINNPIQSVTITFNTIVSAMQYPLVNILDTNSCTGVPVSYNLDSSLFYQWYDGDSSFVKTIIDTGKLWLQVYNQNGCTISDTFIISNFIVNNNVLVDSANFCYGDSVMITINTGYFSPVWYDGATTISHYFNSVGNFSINANDINGCVSNDTVFVSGMVPISFSLGNDTAFCTSTSVDIFAPLTHSTFNWSDGSAASTLIVISTGNFWLSALDSNGCTFVDSVFVEEIIPSPFTLGNDTAFCEGDSINLFAPSTHSNYNWNNGSVLDSIFVSSAGIISLNALDMNNCVYIDSIEIMVNMPLTFSLGGDTIICSGNSIDIFAPGTHYDYNWSNGSALNQIAVDTTEIIWLTAKDLNGCSWTDTMLITLDTCLAIQEIELINANIWPNPFTNYLNIELPNLSRLIKITFISLTGQKINFLNFTNENSRYTIHLDENLPSGIYGLVISTEAGNYLNKIIKQ